jgi:hypothetical protein
MLGLQFVINLRVFEYILNIPNRSSKAFYLSFSFVILQTKLMDHVELYSRNKTN